LAATSVEAHGVSLAWSDNSFNEDGFTMQRSTDGVNWTEFMTFDPDSTSHTDYGLDEGTTYLYRVAALNTAGLSDWSNITQVTTPVTVPLAPTDLVATSVAFNQVALAWKDNSFNELASRSAARATMVHSLRLGPSLPA
jgi:titin